MFIDAAVSVQRAVGWPAAVTSSAKRTVDNHPIPCASGCGSRAQQARTGPVPTVAVVPDVRVGSIE